LLGCILTTRACIDNQKKLLSSNISTCPHNMANFGQLTAEICLSVSGIPGNFNGFRVLPSLLQRRRSPKANQTLQDVWPSPALAHYIYISWGSCTLTKFCPVQYSLYVQVLRSPILAALLHGTQGAGVSQTLRRGTRNGITELSQRAPPIFSWATMILGIGPHSSSFLNLCDLETANNCLNNDTSIASVFLISAFLSIRHSDPPLSTSMCCGF